MKTKRIAPKLEKPVARSLKPIAALLAFSALTYPLHADVVTLKPVADTTLQESFPNNNLGGGTTFTSGGRRQGGRTRGLLRFDVAGSVPAGSTISSVTLAVTVLATPSGGVNSTFDLNRLLASWGEGTGSDHGGSLATAGQASWNNRFAPATPWTSAGGDFSATVSASRSIAGNGAYTFSSTANLVADVQGWLNLPANNFGWVLRSQSETTATTIRRFASRDDTVNAPRLTVTYSPPLISPTLAIVPAGAGQAAISWTPNTPGFVLQETPGFSPTNWANSPSGATNPVVVPAAFPTKFYRLRAP